MEAAHFVGLAHDAFIAAGADVIHVVVDEKLGDAVGRTAGVVAACASPALGESAAPPAAGPSCVPGRAEPDRRQRSPLVRGARTGLHVGRSQCLGALLHGGLQRALCEAAHERTGSRSMRSNLLVDSRQSSGRPQTAATLPTSAASGLAVIMPMRAILQGQVCALRAALGSTAVGAERVDISSKCRQLLRAPQRTSWCRPVFSGSRLGVLVSPALAGTGAV